MARKSRKPAPFAMGRVKCWVMREREEEPRWYWRATIRLGRDSHQAVWSGWATESDARRAVAAQIAEGIEDAPVPAAAKTNDKGLETLRDLLEIWMASVESSQRARKTKILYQQICRSISASYGELAVGRFGLKEWESIRDGLLRGGYSDGTARLYAEILGCAWRWARERGLVPNVVLPASSKIKVRKGTDGHGMDNESTYTEEEWWQIVDVLPEGWVQTMARLLEATGARVGEIASLHWDQVDLDDLILTVRGKTGERAVAIAPALRDYLDSTYPADKRQGRVLDVSLAYVPIGFRHHLGLACEQLEITYRMPKQIRHQTVDRLYSAGVDPSAAAALLGHSPAVALAHYRRVRAVDKARAVALAGLGERPGQAKVVELLPRKAASAE